MKKQLKIGTLVLMFLIFISSTVVYAKDNGAAIEKYTLEKLMQNYSVVALGDKGKEGTASTRLFHVNGQFLINGTLNDAVSYDSYFYYGLNKKDENVASCFVTYNNNNYFSDREQYLCSTLGLNFTNLYNNIVAQQKNISKGLPVLDKGNVKLDVGGYYNLKNVKGINEIHFNNFKNNKNKLTVITIEDSGTVKIPSTYYVADDGSSKQVITNDYIGGDTAYNSETGEIGGYGNYFKYEDVYFGNVIWNIPNATKIVFSGVPFLGHVIAPNADAEMPESNYAGAMIVKDLKAENKSEGHFYPLELELKDLGEKVITISLGCNCKKGVPDPRPDVVYIDIIANGKVVDTVTLSKQNNWTINYKGLPETIDGETKIDYKLGGKYIEENASKVDGYEITAKCNFKNPETSNDNSVIFTIVSILSSLILLFAIIIYSKRKRQLV